MLYTLYKIKANLPRHIESDNAKLFTNQPHLFSHTCGRRKKMKNESVKVFSVPIQRKPWRVSSTKHAYDLSNF